MTDYNSQLNALHEKLAHKAKLKAMLQSLYTQLEDLRQEERRLAGIRSAEQEDVDKLERISLSSIIASIAGNKEEKLSRERAEAYAAALKHDAAVQQAEEVEQKIFSLNTELQSLSGTEQEYETVLAAKRDALKASDPACGAEICRIEDRLAAIAAEKKEIDEAQSAGKNVLWNLSAIEKNLSSAEGWGTWDMLGGGLISDFAKYSYLDDAQNQINELQSGLRQYQTELADVMMQADIQVQTDGFLRFADYFFDDIFSSWAVLNRIQNTQSEISRTRSRVDGIQEQLESTRNALQQEESHLKTVLDETVRKA